MNTIDLSIIVIVYGMRRQAMNTIRSLSPNIQKNIDPSRYEIIVIENESSENLSEESVLEIAENIRYFKRNAGEISPAKAINFGLEIARGKWIGMLIDGARLVTPRVIENVLRIARMQRNCIIAVPGYFIGPCEHQYADLFGHTESNEIDLLNKISWEENPYRLFDVSTISAANPRGLFIPFLECNCFFAPKKLFIEIGGADERFNYPGGGSLNLHMFRLIATHPLAELYFMMAFEGSFHQYHGGVTTSTREDRESLIRAFSDQLNNIWDNKFRSLNREPIIIGPSNSYAQRHLLFSSRRAWRRFTIMEEDGLDFWPDDIGYQRFTEQSR